MTDILTAENFRGLSPLEASASGAASSEVVLQVKFTSKTDVFSTTSTSFTDVTGMSVAITPKSASNLVRIRSVFSSGASNINTGTFFRFLRDSTVIAVGDAAGSRIQSTTARSAGSFAGGGLNGPLEWIDAPSSTSEIIYKLQCKTQIGTVRVGASGDDNDAVSRFRSASIIVVEEITP